MSHAPQPLKIILNAAALKALLGEEPIDAIVEVHRAALGNLIAEAKKTLDKRVRDSLTSGALVGKLSDEIVERTIGVVKDKLNPDSYGGAMRLAHDHLTARATAAVNEAIAKRLEARVDLIMDGLEKMVSDRVNKVLGDTITVLVNNRVGSALKRLAAG